MIVQCPRCSTDAHPVFKCARCSLVFSRDERQARPVAKEKAGPAEQNLSFTFDQPEPDEITGADPITPSGAAPAPPAKGAAGAARNAGNEQEDEYELEPEAMQITGEEDEVELDERPIPTPARPSIPTQAARPATSREDARRAAETIVVRSAAKGASSARRDDAAAERRRAPARRRDEAELSLDDDFEGGDDEIGADGEESDAAPVLFATPARRAKPAINPRRPAPRPQARRRSPMRAVGIAITMICGLYLVLAVMLNTRPELALDSLSQVPLLGRILRDDNLLTWRIQLADIEGSYDRIKGDRSAYVVTGRAINTSNQDLQVIEVEGRLLDAKGVERRRQRVKATNQQRKTIRDLSQSEVEMLLHLEPNRRFVVHPGQSAGFLLVFADPPRDATELSCRVVGARRA